MTYVERSPAQPPQYVPNPRNPLEPPVPASAADDAKWSAEYHCGADPRSLSIGDLESALAGVRMQLIRVTSEARAAYAARLAAHQQRVAELQGLLDELANRLAPYESIAGNQWGSCGQCVRQAKAQLTQALAELRRAAPAEPGQPMSLRYAIDECERVLRTRASDKAARLEALKSELAELGLAVG